MKVSIDVDMTPEELRKLFGLPDVEGFQRQLMEDLRGRIAAGAEGYDPAKLMQPYISSTLASWDLFQKFLLSAGGPGGSETSSSKGGGKESAVKGQS